jgi:hypothetical protein
MDGWIQKPEGLYDFDIKYDDSQLIEGKLEDYSEYDYIVVLCGGLDHHGHCHLWVADRLDVAYDLYKYRSRKIIISGSGSYHKKMCLNREGFVLHESKVAAKYLVEKGVNPDDIMTEWSSLDTIANGFFTLVNFVIPLQLKKVLVITSDFHMARAKAIFDWIYGLWNDQEDRIQDSIQLEYLKVITKHIDQDIITARHNREMKSLQNLRKTIERIRTLKAMHEWFYTEHQAYNSRFNDEQHHDITPEEKKSY